MTADVHVVRTRELVLLFDLPNRQLLIAPRDAARDPGRDVNRLSFDELEAMLLPLVAVEAPEDKS